MVVAGVFLVARLYPVFWEGLNITGSSFNFIVIIGGITILIAAALAFVQNDIKKVLAYSTVSQLGYMMMGLGAGAWLPAVFHIFTHAFFKACLFLAAGSISHSASHHSFDMKKDMGGLRKFMPITFATWIISTLALCGVFPLSGFFSKDEIIDNVGHNGYTLFMIIGLAGAFLTAAYMTRATYLTFFGSPRGAAAGEHHDDDHATDHGHDAHAHDAHAAHDSHDSHASHDAHASHGPRESGPLITIPLIILATLAIGAGFLNATPFGAGWENMKKWVEPSGAVISTTGIDEAHGGAGASRVVALMPQAEEGGYGSPCGKETPKDGICYAPSISHAKFKWSKGALSLAIVFAGMLVSWFLSVQVFERKNRALAGLTKRNKLLGAGHGFLVNKYYLDHLYEKVIVRAIAHPIARGAYWFNQKVLDGIVNGTGISVRNTSRWVYRNVDQRVVDGAVNGSGAAAQGAGSALRPVQSGKVSQYGALLFGAAAIGALVLVIINT
jgi:NADH-quinone oxidoreductase subunit L